MGRRLDMANKNIEKKIGAEAAARFSTAAKQDPEKTLAEYKALLDENKAFEVSFEACSKDGSFTKLLENGVVLLMSGTDTKAAMPYYEPYLGGRLLGHTFEVKVSSIDSEGKIVRVVSARRVRSEKSALVGELYGEINGGRHPIVWGTIHSVNERYATVDILDAGIYGRIRVDNWQKTYLRYLNEDCFQGEVYQFEVTGRAPSKGDTVPPWFLSRVNIPAENPWNKLAIEGVTEGGTILVKCMERASGKTYWWGRSSHLHGIEIQGDYPQGDKLQIFENLSYKCKIKRIRIAAGAQHYEYSFRVIPFAVCDEELALYKETLSLMEDAGVAK